MPIYPEKLSATLRSRLAPVYLLAGDEALLVNEALDTLRAAATAKGFAEREVLHRDRGSSLDELRTSCASGSLFSDRRVVELSCGDGALDAKLAEFLIAYLESPSDDLLLIVRAGALDGRQRNSAWVKAIDRNGGFVYCWPLRPGDLVGWAAARLRAAGLEAEPDALKLLVERTEGNLLALAQDVEKLKLLTEAGTRIQVQDMRQAVADSAHLDAFDWIARIMSGNARGVARGLARLRAQGEALPAIVAALAWNLRQLASAAQMHDAGSALDSVYAKLRIPRPRQADMGRMLRRVRLGQILGWQARMAGIDGMAKRSAEDRAWEELLTCALAMSGSSLPARAPNQR